MLEISIKIVTIMKIDDKQHPEMTCHKISNFSNLNKTPDLPADCNLMYSLSTINLVKHTIPIDINDSVAHLVAWPEGQFSRCISTSKITGKLFKTSLFRSSGSQKPMLC